MDETYELNESFGEYLTRERTLRNIPLEEISQRTRISMKVLQALEQERWEELPADVYVRGFLRTYSRYLGLDENEVLVRYEDQRPRAVTPSRNVFPELHKPKAKSRRLWFVLLLLGCGLFALYWFLGRTLFRGEDIPIKPAPPGPGLRSLPMPPPPPAGN